MRKLVRMGLLTVVLGFVVQAAVAAQEGRSAGSGPRVVAIRRVGDPLTGADTVRFQVLFSESVTGVDATDFRVDSGGIQNARIVSVSGDGDSFLVDVGTGKGTGTVSIDLIDDDSIVLGSVPLGGAGKGNGDFVNGESYRMDRRAPAVRSVKRVDRNPTSAPMVDFQVLFTERVTGVDADDFACSAEGMEKVAVSRIAGGGDQYTVSVNTGEGSGCLRLRVLDDDSIRDESGLPLGGNGAENGLFDEGESYLVDKTDVALMQIERVDENPTSAAQVSFRVTFSRPVVGVDEADFTLEAPNLPEARILAVSGKDEMYAVLVAPGAGEGVLGLNISETCSVADASGERFEGVLAARAAYIVRHDQDRTEEATSEATPQP